MKDDASGKKISDWRETKEVVGYTCASQGDTDIPSPRVVVTLRASTSNSTPVSHNSVRQILQPCPLTNDILFMQMGLKDDGDDAGSIYFGKGLVW